MWKHSPWPVAKDEPASPSPYRSELTVEDPQCSSTQHVLHSVYFDLDALASSDDDEFVDVRKCKDLSVTVLYKPEEDDTPAKSEMAASDRVSQLESGAGDVRKVVRHWDEPRGSQMAQPVRPRSRHELSAPTVTGKCKPGKMIRTVSASPLTVDMTVSCKPDSVKQGVNADVLPPTDNVGMSAADVNTSTAIVTAPGLGGSDGRLTSKKFPSGDLSESSGVWVVVLVVLVVLAYVAVGHGRKLSAVVLAQSCEGGPIADQSRVRIVCLMCQHCRRSNPIGKTECPNSMGCCCRRY